MVFFYAFFKAMQESPAPTFDQILKAIETLGFPIVVAILLLLLVVSPLFLLARVILTGVSNKADGLGTQITGAITLFSGTLATMSNRNEESADKLADALNRQSVTLADALNRQTEAVNRQGEILAQVGESIRILMSFTSQQMSQQAVLTSQVAHMTPPPPIVPDPITGVIIPVEKES